MSLGQGSNPERPEAGDFVHVRYKTVLEGHPLVSGIKNGKFNPEGSVVSSRLQRVWLETPPCHPLDAVWHIIHSILLFILSKACNEIKYSFLIGSGVVDPHIEEKLCEITVGESINITSLEGSDPLFVSEVSSCCPGTDPSIGTCPSSGDGGFKVSF